MTDRILRREEVRRIDAWAIERWGVAGLVLMENAGRGCADVLCRRGIDGPVVICCGRGNNAGDGFVIARHLDLRGYPVAVLLLSDPADLTGDAAANYRILEHTDVPVAVAPAAANVAAWIDGHLAGAAWIVDALLGTGSRGAPRPPYDIAIERMNACPAKRMAVDLPSGLDCDTGETAGAVFHADCTCTFVARKPGLIAAAGRPFAGEVHVLDIGVPAKLIDEALAAG